MILIIIPLLLILVLTTLRAVCVKSFKSHLIIDGIIFVLMLALSAYKHFTVIRIAVLLVLLLWMIAGAVVLGIILHLIFGLQTRCADSLSFRNINPLNIWMRTKTMLKAFPQSLPTTQ